jgi:hypothetical protein
VRAGKHVCRKCEFQVESWCKEAETWVQSGTEGGEELLAQAPQARIVTVSYSRRHELLRARLLMAITERQVGTLQRELLDRFREGYKQGKLEAVVGEWRDGHAGSKIERSMRTEGGVAIPRPRAGSAARGKLRQMVHGVVLWIGYAERVQRWREEMRRDLAELHELELAWREQELEEQLEDHEYMEEEQDLEHMQREREKQRKREEELNGVLRSGLRGEAPSALAGAPSARPKTQKRVTFRIKTSRAERCEQLIARVLHGQEEKRMIAAAIGHLADQKVVKT